MLWLLLLMVLCKIRGEFSKKVMRCAAWQCPPGGKYMLAGYQRAGRIYQDSTIGLWDEVTQ